MGKVSVKEGSTGIVEFHNFRVSCAFGTLQGQEQLLAHQHCPHLPTRHSVASRMGSRSRRESRRRLSSGQLMCTRHIAKSKVRLPTSLVIILQAIQFMFPARRNFYRSQKQLKQEVFQARSSIPSLEGEEIGGGSQVSVSSRTNMQSTCGN